MQSLHSPPYIWRQSLSLHLKLTDSTRLGDQQVPGISLPPVPNTDSSRLPSQTSHMDATDHGWSSSLHSKTFINWAISPSFHPEYFLLLTLLSKLGDQHRNFGGFSFNRFECIIRVVENLNVYNVIFLTVNTICFSPLIQLLLYFLIMCFDFPHTILLEDTPQHIWLELWGRLGE